MIMSRLRQMKDQVEVYLRKKGPKKLEYPSEEVAAAKEAILEVVAGQLDRLERRLKKRLGRP